MGLQSYAMIASAIGQRLNVRVRIAGNMAYTDGELVNLPSIAIDDDTAEGDRRTALKALREILLGYLIHEAGGHVAHTDFVEWQKRVGTAPDLFRHLCNIFEDVRIEKAISLRYPGFPELLAATVAHVVDKGLFAPITANDHPAQIITGYLLYKGRLDHLGQSILTDLASEAECALCQTFPEIAQQLADIVRDAGHTQSTREACDLADRTWQLLLSAAEEPPPDEEEEGEEETEEEDPRERRFRKRGKPDEPEQGDSQDDEDSTAGDGENQDQSKDAEKGRGGKASDEDDSAEKPESSSSDDTGESGEDAGDGKSGESSETPEDADKPGSQSKGDGKGDQPDDGKAKVSGKGAGGDSSQDDEASREAAEAAKNYQDGEGHDVASELSDVLQKMIEQNPDISGGETMMAAERCRDESGHFAEEVIRVARAQSGPLRRSLLELLQSHARSKKWRAEQGRRLQGRHLSRLVSGDPRVFTRKVTHRAVNTAISLVVDMSSSMRGHEEAVAREAAAALAVAIEAIPGSTLEFSVFPYRGRQGESLGIVKTFDERVAHLKRRILSFRATGCTPMAEAMMAAGGRLALRREPRKIMIVITDGHPNNAAMVLEAKAAMPDVEFVGIGICSSSVEGLFDDHLVIESADELPKKLLQTVKSLLAA